MLQMVSEQLQSVASLSQFADLAPNLAYAEMNGTNDKLPPKTALPRLGSLPQHPPPSKTGKVVWAWPRIIDALNAGWRLGQIWEALKEDGIEMPYNQFRVYVSRIRRRKETALRQPASPERPSDPPFTDDPYAGIRKQRKLKRRTGFEYDPFSTDKDLLE